MEVREPLLDSVGPTVERRGHSSKVRQCANRSVQCSGFRVYPEYVTQVPSTKGLCTGTIRGS